MLKLHIATIWLSYFVFLVASIAALLYLVCDHALKHKRTGVIFSRLPDLSFLDKLNYRGIGLGFPILTLSILSGFVWAQSVHGAYWWNVNSRQVYSLVLWLAYALILHVRLSAKMRGRKVSVLSLLASFVIILSLCGHCH
jgi:ABC-type transport system involved in cytochrome c biogenesis permease subunit